MKSKDKINLQIKFYNEGQFEKSKELAKSKGFSTYIGYVRSLIYDDLEKNKNLVYSKDELNQFKI